MYDTDLPSQYDLLSDEQKVHVCSWIKNNLVQIRTFNKRQDSYSLHGFYKRSTCHSIRNGAFKQAMKNCGFKVLDESAQNWKFNVSNKSPGIKQFKPPT